MNDLELRRQVLLARIDAHRSMLDLEVRCARASVGGMARVLGVFGLDGTVAGAMVSGLRLAGGQSASAHDVTAALPLLVAAVLRVLASRRDDEPPPADQPAS